MLDVFGSIRDNLQEALYEDSDEFVDVLFDNLAIDDMELSTEQVNKILNDVPYALAIRDPSLWEMQCQKARIWNRRHFALWLSRQSKKMELDTYLSHKHNQRSSINFVIRQSLVNNKKFFGFCMHSNIYDYVSIPFEMYINFSFRWY
jgi:hypothetical protein